MKISTADRNHLSSLLDDVARLDSLGVDAHTASRAKERVALKITQLTEGIDAASRASVANLYSNLDDEDWAPIQGRAARMIASHKPIFSPATDDKGWPKARVVIRCTCGWKATAKYGYRDSLINRYTHHQNEA